MAWDRSNSQGSANPTALRDGPGDRSNSRDWQETQMPAQRRECHFELAFVVLDAVITMLLLLVILPAVLLVTVATNANKKCSVCGEANRFRGPHGRICTSRQNKKSSAARARRVAATSPATARKCARCHLTKVASEFQSHRGLPGGLDNYCKSCVKIRVPARQQRYRDQLVANNGATCRACKQPKSPEQMRGQYAMSATGSMIGSTRHPDTHQMSNSDSKSFSDSASGMFYQEKRTSHHTHLICWDAPQQTSHSISKANSPQTCLGKTKENGTWTTSSLAVPLT